VVSRDGGRTFSDPVRVSQDNWQLDGCPENGPAIAVDARQRVHAVWPTLVRERGRETLQLFHSTTVDGQRFSPRAALPTAGQAYHPQIALAPAGSPIVVWDESASGTRRIKLWRGLAAEGLGPGLYPAIAATSSQAVVAWTLRVGDRSTIRVRRAMF
jgi:hypothetical protein